MLCNDWEWGLVMLFFLGFLLVSNIKNILGNFEEDREFFIYVDICIFCGFMLLCVVEKVLGNMRLSMCCRGS